MIPALSVIIISHGHEAMLARCVASLAPALEGVSAEILVVDNLPGGHAAAALAGLPARVIVNAEPVGFAANVNRGAAATTGQHLLFLNPDTEHLGGRIAQALAMLEARPEIGLLGCTLLGEDGAPQQSFRRFPSPAVPIARGLGADRWPWQPGWYRRAMMTTARREKPFAADWVFGAFLLLRRSDFERVGGMDEGYRMYYEDVDLAWRLRRAGLATFVFPDLQFLHAHQRSSAKRPFSRLWRWHVASALRYSLRSMGRKLALLLALVSVAGPAVAQGCRFPGPWTRVEPPSRLANGQHLVPIRIAADPSVIRRNGRYEMFFTTAGSSHVSGIARAEGTDGKTWSVWRSPTRPDPLTDLVLPTPPDGWEAPGIETADVMIGPDGLWRMYYTGNRPPQGSATYAIGLATSTDGIRWTRRATPVLEPASEWERPICTNPANPTTCTRGGVLEPSVLWDATGRQYRMWYVGLGEPRNSFRSFRIGHATSPDGITWTRRPQPVFALGAPGSWDEMWTSHVNVIADPGGGYHMFYFGSAPGDYREGVELQRGAIGHAFSADGIAWQRNPRNPILAPRPGQVDEWTAGGPSAVMEQGRIRLWYFGARSGGLVSDIIMAEAACLP